MLMTVDELKRYVNTDAEEKVLEAQLQALELAIKGYTNNDFARVLEANNGQYPMDVKMGAVNLMKWEMDNRKKVGIQSESLSRHSVTYFNMDGDNSIMGYPRSLMGFLKPYMRARFGQGLSV